MTRAAPLALASGRAPLALGLLDAAILIMTVLSLATLAAGAAWLPDMLTFFRPHLAAASLGVLVAAALVRRGWRIGLALALLAFNVWPLLVRVGPAPGIVPHGAATLRVMSANVLHDNPRKDLFRSVVTEAAPDVLVLQELENAWAAAADGLPGLPYRASAQLRRVAGEGTGIDIVSRFPLAARQVGLRLGAIARQEGWSVGGSMAVRAVVDPGPRGPAFIVYAVHPPTPRSAAGWRLRGAYLDAIGALVRAEPPGTPVLVVGDWNTPPWSPLFARFLAQTGMASAERWPFPPATRIFSIPGLGAPQALGTPIDRVAVSPGIALSAFRIGAPIGADHLPVIADFAVR